MATVATRREKKTCLIKTNKNQLDSHRPSHGRRLHSELLHVVSALLEWAITRKELATAHDSRSLNV